MGIINILDKHTANLIAAGEVVERPSSAVKEMLENCADAGATSVTVEIQNGGTTFIRISDNGCGIAREDVPKTVLRHATSKIKNGSDLAAISTLGFRGEALAAIAAVSRLRIMTKRPVDPDGTLFECSFGEQVSITETGCPDGTTIIVEDIFENTPARRKFLKKNSTEASSVFAVCEKFALSRPDIAIKFISDGAIKLQTPGDGNLMNTIYSALGREFANALLPVEYELDGVRVYGFIGKPEISRPNRNMQNFFVNGRYIKSRTMLASLEEGFRGFCPTGKFPGCVLFAELDLSHVDVNIHPAKLEIKFADDRKIFDCIYFAVKNALSKGISSMFSYTSAVSDHIPSVYLPDKDKQEEKVASSETKNNNTDTFTDDKPFVQRTPSESEEKKWGKSFADSPIEVDKKDISVINEKKENSFFMPPALSEQADNQTEETQAKETFPTEEKATPVIEKLQIFEQEEIIPKKELINTEYIGEAFNTYIIAERDGKLYIIDKHAAHERIIYERIKHSSDNNDAQFLLEPVAVTLTSKEFDAVSGNIEYYKRIGFDFEEFGDNTYLIRSVPFGIDLSDVKDIFTFLAGKLAEGNTKSTGEIFDKALYTAACKAAIKAGNKFTEHDNKRILKEIFENDAVLYCPHGRPVLVEFTKERIEKMFGRL